MSFVHLHVHSSYSSLDGAMSPKQIAQRTKNLNQNSVALTDHGNMHGTLKFYDECRKAGVKPLLGIEAYLSPTPRHIKEKIEGLPTSFHQTLIAINDIGLHNLYKLSSLAYTEGFYYHPRIDHELLEEFNEGIICLSGCVKGKIQYYLAGTRHYLSSEHYDKSQADDYYKLAELEAQTLKRIFGDRLYIEVQRIIPEHVELVPLQIKLAKELGIECVATCDAHYETMDDADFHEQILCLSTNKNIKDKDRLGKLEGLYLKSEEEMLELFHDLPETVHNTQVVADRCNVKIKEKYDYIFPVFTNSQEEDTKVFEEKAWEGLKNKELDNDSEYIERLKYEIQTIKEMGFPSYFLVVSDYVNWAKQNSIAMGPGRGSAAGSLTAYCLGITDIDPIRYGLLFQRFLNPGRRSMPDIDTDVCMRRRGEVIQYLTDKYGQDKISQIATFSEFKPRGAVRDFARAQGEPISLGEKASKLVPPAQRGREPTWEETLRASPKLLGSEFNDIVRMARKSEGIIRQRGIHAGGVIISREPLQKVAPVCLGKNKEIVSQWGMEDLERIGLVKMDILGLMSLTLLDLTLQWINSTQPTLTLSDIPLRDQTTFSLIQAGKTSGLFQMDQGGGIRQLCLALQPTSVGELAAISALYRPGPIDSGMTQEYVKRVNGQTPVTYLVPELEPILKETRGLLVYQEQAMRIATDLGGYSLEDADNLRKAIGKKLPEKMAEEEEKLISGMIENGISESNAKEIWSWIKVQQDYSFNRAHAVAYAHITYYTAYLKANFPVEFYCALLTLHMDQREKMIEYLADCRANDVQVLPPHINESETGFSIKNGVIRFGLAAIKGVGEKIADKIIKERRQGEFTRLLDFYDRTKTSGVNKKTVESLAKAGALDSFEVPRAAILEVLDKMIGYGKEVEKYDRKMQTFEKRRNAYYEREALIELAKRDGTKKPGSLKEPTLPTKPSPVTIPDVEELQLDDILRLEKEMLGLYVTSHPLYAYEADILERTNAHTASIGDCTNGEHVSLLGVISMVKHITTRAGKKMGVIDLEDLHGHIEVVVFSRTYQYVKDILEEGNIVLVSGKADTASDRGQKVIANAITLLNKETKEPEEAISSAFIEIASPNKEVVQQIKEVLDICKGNIEANIQITAKGVKFYLDNTTTLSLEGLKQLKKIKGVKVKERK